MKRKLSMLLVLVMILSVITACSSPAGEETSGDTTEGVAEGPSRDDLNLAMNSSWGTSDPHHSTALVDLPLFRCLFETLIFFDENTGELEPELAKSYDISEDGKTYTFNLRDDVYFHNGDQLKASDVIFSLERSRRPDKVGKLFMDGVEDMVALDDFTVQLKLNAPRAPFLHNISNIFIISEREVTEQGEETFGNKAHKAGTGAYYIEHMNKNEKMVFKAFDKYYKGEASIKTVNYFVITDSAAGIIAFESGELDWYNCAIPDYRRLEDSEEYNSEVLIANNIAYLAVNPVSPVKALQNEKVRHAIGYALDKDELNMAGFDGLALKADYWINPDLNIAAPRGDVVFNYDPEKSKALLVEAGYPDGVDIGTLLSYPGDYAEVFATVIQQQLKKVGITVELVWSDRQGALKKSKVPEYDIYTAGGNANGDYDYIRNRFHSTLEPGLNVKFSQTEYDQKYCEELIDKAGSTMNLEERTAIHKELSDYLMNTGIQFPIVHRAVALVWDKNLNPVNSATRPIIYKWSWK